MVGGGTPPYAATFYTNGQLAGSLGAAPFTTNLGVLAVGSYTSYVHATDSSVLSAQQANKRQALRAPGSQGLFVSGATLP